MISTNFVLFALCALFTIAHVMADCPHSCSGHGNCGENNKCTCYPDYGDADCSVRACPIAGGQECSGRGSCDRKNGDCKCDAGYEGEDCSRTSCPNGCSNHGSCSDGECVCDFSYSGADCSSRLCPRGDDPLTKETYPGSGRDQQDEIQQVAIALSASGYTLDGDFVLTFADAYGGSWTTRPIPVSDTTGDIDAKSVEDIIESLPNQAIPDVTVAKGTFSTTANTYDITFNSGANSGDVNALTCSISGCDVSGCQPRYSGVLQKKSTAIATSANYVLNWYGDNQASASITVDAASNAITATSATVLSFASAAFPKGGSPVAGADITFTFNGGTTYTTTVSEVALNGQSITTVGAHGIASATSNNLVITYENPANTVAYAGVVGTSGFATVAAGDVVEFTGSAKNNKKFSVVSVSPVARSLVLAGNVATELSFTGSSITVIETRNPIASEVSCTVTETKKGTKEDSVCGGRGSCDGSSGICACYPGYTGENCDKQITEM